VLSCLGAVAQACDLVTSCFRAWEAPQVPNPNLPAVVRAFQVRFGILNFSRAAGCGLRSSGHLVNTFNLGSLLNQFLIIALGVIAEVSQTLFLGGALQKIRCSTGGTLDVDRLLP